MHWSCFDIGNCGQMKISALADQVLGIHGNSQHRLLGIAYLQQYYKHPCVYTNLCQNTIRLHCCHVNSTWVIKWCSVIFYIQLLHCLVFNIFTFLPPFLYILFNPFHLCSFMNWKEHANNILHLIKIKSACTVLNVVSGLLHLMVLLSDLQHVL